jgi:hypothetical protein
LYNFNPHNRPFVFIDQTDEIGDTEPIAGVGFVWSAFHTLHFFTTSLGA